MLIDDRFELKARIGVGGSASVYEAVDTSCNERVAVKVLHPALLEEDMLRERFDREAALLARFEHPCIPRWIGASDTTSEIAWFALEFVQGTSLSVAASKGLGARALAEAILEISDALRYLHENGVVHRDVKPENILVDSIGMARLVDFGISRDERADLTMAGDMMGTPGFMAPEQRIDPHDAGPPADIFGLGVTLFAVLTKRSGLEITHPSTRRAALKEVPKALRPFVTKATEFEPAARFQDAVSVQWALADALELL